MFFQYETELAKERERLECIRRAETDQLIQASRPRRKKFPSQLRRNLLHSVGRLLGNAGERLVALDPKTNSTRRSHATQ
ncbi:MAG: hypothetical protein L0Y55_20420 [Anaerolineales bacterium]|nr:hypothetical protein [Anaerolineales bacterium]